MKLNWITIILVGLLMALPGAPAIAQTGGAEQQRLERMADILQRESQLLLKERAGLQQRLGVEVNATTKVEVQGATAAEKVQNYEAFIKDLKIEILGLKGSLSKITLKETIAAISQQVAQIRGLSLKKPIEFDYLQLPKLMEILERSIEEQYPDGGFAEYEFCLKQFGMIPADVDLLQILKAMLGEQVAGLYDDGDGKLYVMESFGLEGELAKIILAHEICHALQDQHYDLKNYGIHIKNNDDRVTAAACVIEGDATILMGEWAAQNLSWRIILELPSVIFMNQEALNSAPPALQEMLLFPYLSGMAFMQQADRRRYEEQFANPPKSRYEEIYANPPESTEQVLHPEKYFSVRDRPTTVTLSDYSEKLGEGWTRTFSNVMGELGIRMSLDVIAPEQAINAAAGWDGDRFELYRAGESGRLSSDRFLLLWVSAWDFDKDAREFAEAFSREIEGVRIVKLQHEQAVAVIITNDEAAEKIILGEIDAVLKAIEIR